MARTSSPRQPSRYWIPAIVLTISLTLTALTTLMVHRSSRARDTIRFQAAVAQTRSLLDQHLDAYVNLLRGAAGLFAASDEVSPNDFRQFVMALNVPVRFKGIQGIGFTQRVPPERAAEVQARMRRYHPGFRFWSDDASMPLHGIVYLEPLDQRNRLAIGYNMYSEAVRRKAMAAARDNAEPVASGKVRLKQEGVDGNQAGFLVYLPIYRGGGTPATVEQRRDLLEGFVYSPYRMEKFVQGVFDDTGKEVVRFWIWDGERRTRDTLLYPSENSPGPVPRPTLSADLTLPVPGQGRGWSIHFEPTTAFFETSNSETVPLTLMGGIIISLLLYGITLVQADSRLAAEAAADSLRRSDARSRRLLESNIIGVAFVTLDGCITEANNAFLKMLGQARAEFTPGKLCWERITPPEYRARDTAAARSLRISGECYPYEKEFIRGDGRRVPVLLGAARLEPEGDLSVAYAVDLSRQKRVEAALRSSQAELEGLYAEARAARDEAEQANRLKDEFLATVSHELRTPLNAIVGYTQLLRMGRRGPEDTARALEAIERNVKAQAQLIGDLLDVSRIISGKMRLNVETVDLGAVVEAAVESVALAASSREITLEACLAPDIPPMQGDPARLQQVFWNLLTNAIRFTGPAGRVSITARVAGRQVEVEVRDTGIGIRPEYTTLIFDRFRQVDSSTTRQHVGLGLGLSIVRSLVEMHGGSVKAESEGEGKGASFTVTLPLRARAWSAEEQPDAPTASALEGAQAGDATALPRLEGVRVLAVDDEADAREMLRGILTALGAEVRVEGSAEAAWDAFSRFRPHVLLSDIAMPGEDGYSLLHRIRSLDTAEGGRVPAVALTAFAREQDRDLTAEAGFQIHLAKPIEPAILARCIHRLATDTGIDSE